MQHIIPKSYNLLYQKKKKYIHLQKTQMDTTFLETSHMLYFKLQVHLPKTPPN